MPAQLALPVVCGRRSRTKTPRARLFERRLRRSCFCALRAPSVETAAFRVDPSSPTPLFEQPAAGIRAVIASAEVGPRERLPPARAVARELGVNMHTVLRAYAELRDDGLVELRRGRGAVVRGDGAAGRAKIRSLAEALTVEGRRQGLSRSELHGLIEELS